MMKPLPSVLFILICLPIAANPQAAGRPEPALSASEVAAVKRQIATLHSSVDRSVANGWTNSKKVAELLCRPVALPVLKKQISGADRVFLGTDDPRTLTLESNGKLIGTGSARTTSGWHDFTFTCELNPSTAKVTSFEPVMMPPSK